MATIAASAALVGSALSMTPAAQAEPGYGYGTGYGFTTINLDEACQSRFGPGEHSRWNRRGLDNPGDLACDTPWGVERVNLLGFCQDRGAFQTAKVRGRPACMYVSDGGYRPDWWNGHGVHDIDARYVHYDGYGVTVDVNF